MSFAFEKTPRISLGSKLVPVQYREHEDGLLHAGQFITSSLVLSVSLLPVNRDPFGRRSVYSRLLDVNLIDGLFFALFICLFVC